MNNKVVWFSGGESVADACCLCANTKDNKLLLKAHHWQSEKGYLNLALCGACESAWFINAAAENAPYPSIDSVLKDPNFILLIHHYFELVNGLD